jgi:hypothetical protein
MPLLVYLSEVLARTRDPTLKFLERLSELRALKHNMERRKCKETITKFLSVVCPRDQTDQAKHPAGSAAFKTKRELIFEELNQLVAYTKRLEVEIRRSLDTPIRIFRLLLARYQL